MSRMRSWSDDDLRNAVVTSRSYREVIRRLNLIPAGGNYNQIQTRIAELKLDTAHFTGRRWNTGLRYVSKRRSPLEKILIVGSKVQSFKLKRRLFDEGLKHPACELCGWSERSVDGRIPVELDHINGINTDNRIENLRILCPNCHSLQVTHRGKNKKVRLKYH